MIAVAVAPSALATITTGAAWRATDQPGDEEHDAAERPGRDRGDGPVERHPQRAGAGQLGGGRIGFDQQVVPALPAEDRHQQFEVPGESGEEQQDHRADEDHHVDRRQVLQQDPVVGRQAVTQEPEDEQAADDVGLQHAQREDGPGSAHDPSDECADSPGERCCRGHRNHRIGRRGLVGNLNVPRQVAHRGRMSRKDHKIVANRTLIGLRRGCSLLLPLMTGVFTRLVGQHVVEAELLAAARAARAAGGVIRLTPPRASGI